MKHLIHRALHAKGQQGWDGAIPSGFPPALGPEPLSVLLS